ncbi:MAG TPA: SpoVR family protein [Epulopiscium sp.]|nr:SpoVR family protein [Candidatus Epulonipiscium sp.]
MNFKFEELIKWNEKIEIKARGFGLDYYFQEFEVISFEDMLCYETYVGMPCHYPHWSFGKSYEKLKTLYSYDLTGLPYEMVINSDPCIAYLMKDNSLLVQILTMAHVYGHNDFFKNNRLFKKYTRANLSIEMFKNHATRIRSYIQDPSIGYAQVEKVLDAAHAIKLQWGECEQEDISNENLLLFIMENGNLEDWQRDIVMIVAEQSKYFAPQIETKIMNEGWASWWHYQILQSLDLPANLQIEFLKTHNSVIAPSKGAINPYYIGFKIWESLSIKYKENPDKLLQIREVERDASFIRNYLTFDLCKELNLFEFQEEDRYYVVSEVSNQDGWRRVRNQLALMVGYGSVPNIVVEGMQQSDRTLTLKHYYDERELHLNYASETLKHIQSLWGGKVILKTVLNNIERCITCNEQGKVSVESCHN